MKNLRSLLVIATLLTLSFTVFSSFKVAKESTTAVVKKDLTVNTTNSNKPNPLHGDVWFAFTAIGFIGTYLAFKK